jgi:cell division septation protein DedD
VTKGKATESKQRIAWGRYLLVFFVAAWMFVLGLLVGRGTAPVHFDTRALQKELAALRDAMMQKEREAVEKAVRGEDDKAPLEFYEALKTDEPDTRVDIPAVPAPVHEKGGAAAATADAGPPHKSRTTVLGKQVGAVKPPTPARPASPIPGTRPGALTIQVASMKDGTAAERIVANLKKEGYPAYLSRKVIPGKGLWFRVRVGHYESREQSAADMNRLMRSQKKPILVKN